MIGQSITGGAANLILRDVYLNIGAGRGRVHRRDNKLDMRPQFRPLLFPQQNDSYLAACKVLLIADVLVRRYQPIEPGCFGGVE